MKWVDRAPQESSSFWLWILCSGTGTQPLSARMAASLAQQWKLTLFLKLKSLLLPNPSFHYRVSNPDWSQPYRLGCSPARWTELEKLLSGNRKPKISWDDSSGAPCYVRTFGQNCRHSEVIKEPDWHRDLLTQRGSQSVPHWVHVDFNDAKVIKRERALPHHL